MKFGRKQEVVPEPPPSAGSDPTGWMVSELALLLLLHSHEVKYMAMLGYTFVNGAKLFPQMPADSSLSYKFVSMVLRCTGGGILVPIFINSIPVSLAQDAYPIAILLAFLMHQYVPILREIFHLSPYFEVMAIVMYETYRAYVVVGLTSAAGEAITPTIFSIPVFGPIFCGAIAGCGGLFLPFDQGLEPIKKSGLGHPMISALIGATFYHLFLNTSLSSGVIRAKDKAHFVVASFFIVYNLYVTFPGAMIKIPSFSPAPTSVKDEVKKDL